MMSLRSSTAMVTVYYILVLLALVFAVLVFIAPEKKLHVFFLPPPHD